MSKKKNKRVKNAAANKSSLAPSKKESKIPFLPLAVLAIALIGIGFFTLRNDNTGYVNATDIANKGTTGSGAESNIENLKGGETKPVLSPTRFTGKTASAYRVAQENSELLDYMYCYCHCRKTIGHKSLLSCFTDGHAAKCTICQDQAFYAQIMQDKGFDIGEVRKEVDRKFWRPFS